MRIFRTRRAITTLLCLTLFAAALPANAYGEPSDEPAAIANTPVPVNEAAIANAPASTGPQAAGSRPDPCVSNEPSNGRRLDRTYAFLTKRLCQPAAWFDNFFSDERHEEEQGASTSIRVRNDFRWAEREHFKSKYSAFARVSLPGIQRRLNIVIQAAGDDYLITPLNNLFTDNTQGQTDNNQVRAGLRYALYESLRHMVNVNAGIHLKLPPVPYMNVRYFYLKPIGEKSLFRFTETVFWDSDNGLGETSRLDLERIVRSFDLARASFYSTRYEGGEGFELGLPITYMHRLADNKALSYELAAYGVSQPALMVTSYILTMNYRQSIIRPWILVSLVPEVSWPREDDWLSKLAFTFRVEFQLDSFSN